MQFNITFKTIFEYVLKKLVLCIQIRFVSTEKTTRIASRASCYDWGWVGRLSAHPPPIIKMAPGLISLQYLLLVLYNVQV